MAERRNGGKKMPRNTMLVIDPTGESLPKISAAIRPFSSRLMWAENVTEGKRLISEGRPEIILITDDAPDFDKGPEDVLSLIDSLKLAAQIIVLTRNPDFDRAMELVGSGVFSVLSLPIDQEKLRLAVRRVLENLSLLSSLVEHSRADSEKELLIYKRLARSQELPDLTSAIIDAAEELFPGAVCAFEPSSELRSYLPEVLSEILPEIHSGDGPEERAEPLSRPEGETPGEILGCAAETEEARDAESAPPAQVLERELGFKNSVLGKITLSFPYRSPSLASLNMEAFEELAWAASLHLYQAKLYLDAVKLASKDPLTSLLNRRVFMESLDREFARAKRHDTPMSLITLDIDHFKSVNDTYGHQTGDKVLKWLSEVLKATARAGDIVGRVGGEEFGIILPWTGPEQARILAMRIREALAESHPPTRHPLLKPTISQGISSMEHFLINSPEDLIYWSDQAMYLAKKEGRDAVRLASDLQPKSQFEDTRYVFQ
jgi:diguanylate cyclase (GGDEF)-like protein